MAGAVTLPVPLLALTCQLPADTSARVKPGVLEVPSNRKPCGAALRTRAKVITVRLLVMMPKLPLAAQMPSVPSKVTAPIAAPPGKRR